MANAGSEVNPRDPMATGIESRNWDQAAEMIQEKDGSGNETSSERERAALNYQRPSRVVALLSALLRQHCQVQSQPRNTCLPCHSNTRTIYEVPPSVARRPVSSKVVLPEDTLNDGGDAADIGVPVTEGGIRGVVEGSAAAPGPPEEGRDRRDSTKDTLDATAARHRAQGTRRRTLQPLYTAKDDRYPKPFTAARHWTARGEACWGLGWIADGGTTQNPSRAPGQPVKRPGDPLQGPWSNPPLTWISPGASATPLSLSLNTSLYITPALEIRWISVSTQATCQKTLLISYPLHQQLHHHISTTRQEIQEHRQGACQLTDSPAHHVPSK